VGFTSVEFDVTDQVLIINSESIRYLRKKQERNGAVHQVIIDFQESLRFGKKGALSIVLTDVGVHTKRMVFGKMS
jgi:hypothetical protein